jgi:hypothetical protein
MDRHLLEIIGYGASALVAVSLMMSNIWRLRCLNLAGSLVFSGYAMLCRVWPVAAVNAFIVAVDASYLWELHSKKDFFSLLDVAEDDKIFLVKFIELYRADIKKFFPDFEISKLFGAHYIFILRNLTPVGLFVYEDEGNGTARIRLDYVVEAYRDFTNAHFLFHTRYMDFIKSGFKEFVLRNPSPKHEKYIKKVGFTPSVANPAVYIKPLAVGRDFAAQASGGA